MAENNLYLESLNSLSAALEKGVALSSISSQIKKAYSLIPTGSNNDPKMMMDALLEALPYISKLQNDEKELKRVYVENLNKTINSIIDYVYTIEREDLNEPFITNLQKFLQVLIDVISSSFSILKDESYTIDAETAGKVLKKISTFGGIPQADNINEKIKQLFLLIGLSYVG